MTIIPSEQLAEEVRALDFTVEDWADIDVVCPELTWVKESSVWCKENPFVFVAESHDCDDAVDEFKVMATKALLANPELIGHGHAVMRCKIVISQGANLNGIGGGPHKTSLIRTAEGDIYFFERQSGLYEKATIGLSDGRVTPFNAWL